MAGGLAILACGAHSACARVVGNGTPASCTSAAVVAAVKAGGSNPNAGFQTSGPPGIFFLRARAPTVVHSVLRP